MKIILYFSLFLCYGIICSNREFQINSKVIEPAPINSSQNSTYEAGIKCRDRCSGYFFCNYLTGQCEHKGFFPIYPLEMLEVLIFFLISMVATSVGVGGGTIYSSLLLFIENFTPSEAYPISTCLILICSICTFYMGVKDKYENPSNNFIDYDLVIILCPALLVGTKIGTIFNKILSNLFLTVLLTGFIFYNIKKMHISATKQREKELKEEASSELQSKKNDTKYSLLKDNLLSKNNKNEKIPRKSSYNSHVDDIEKEIEENSNMITRKIIEEEKDPLRFDRIKYLLIFLGITILDQIIEGNSKLPSLIGLKRCSFMYWLVFFVFIIVSFFLVNFSFKMAKHNYEYKISLSPEFRSNIFDLLEKDYNRIIGLGFLGGLIAGMLGIGGGMITTPIFLSLGLDPKTATSTSNLLIMFTAFTGSILFIFSGQLYITFSLCMAVPCSIASLYGSRLINEEINRTKKSSILLYILFYCMIASFTILIITFINRMSDNKETLSSFFQIKSYCT